MPAGLNGPDGRPALRTRLLAALVVIGMLAIAAPALVPVVGWVLTLATP